MLYDVIIIGGGAAGMAAAITAAKRGLKTAILEANDRLGKKLLATGNGRCNLAGSLPLALQYNTEKVQTVFEKNGLSVILAFFKEIGVLTRQEEDRYYPYSEQASSVLNALRSAIDRLDIDVFTSNKVLSIEGKGPFTVYAAGMYQARNVILATGSAAGFGENSHSLYAPYGHPTTALAPSLVPLLTETEYLKGLKGVRVSAKVSLEADGVTIGENVGEIIFKDNGLSGSAVFSLSTAMARDRSGRQFTAVIDFMPEYTLAGAASTLSEAVKNGQGLQGVFHKEIINNIERRLQTSVHLAKAETLAALIKRYTVKIKSLSAFSLAQVTSGGLENSGFDFSTMESLKQKNLYAAGEALDVDGECGGYNLLWAWASGITAGENIK